MPPHRSLGKGEGPCPVSAGPHGQTARAEQGRVLGRGGASATSASAKLNRTCAPGPASPPFPRPSARHPWEGCAPTAAGGVPDTRLGPARRTSRPGAGGEPASRPGAVPGGAPSCARSEAERTPEPRGSHRLYLRLSRPPPTGWKFEAFKPRRRPTPREQRAVFLAPGRAAPPPPAPPFRLPNGRPSFRHVIARLCKSRPIGARGEWRGAGEPRGRLPRGRTETCLRALAVGARDRGWRSPPARPRGEGKKVRGILTKEVAPRLPSACGEVYPCEETRRLRGRLGAERKFLPGRRPGCCWRPGREGREGGASALAVPYFPREGIGSGKSSLTIQFVEGQFVDSYDPTIENTFTKLITVNGQEYHLQLVDTAGQDEYSIFPQTYSIDINGYILVYSVTSIKSFEVIKVIHGKLLDMVGKVQIPIMLVGNKKDLHMERVISYEEGKALAESWNAAFLESSAKENQTAVDVFRRIILEAEKIDGAASQGKSSCSVM
uniref:GTP-binding protein Rheb n=4 Tax=Boreoeutheria TaxID=1437010 RepID=A0A2K6V167_SAIBB